MHNQLEGMSNVQVQNCVLKLCVQFNCGSLLGGYCGREGR